MTAKILRIGTRGSLLATAQTGQLAARLQAAHPGLECETVIIKTRGDLMADAPLPRNAGKGFFTREIETALLADEIDLAVHSLKDLPTVLPDGLVLGAIPEREDPSDALVGLTLDALCDAGGSKRIGTSSLRRAAQLRRLVPGCTVCELRGNIDTRLRKVSEGVVDCAVLAYSGMRRLDRGESATQVLSPDEMLSAPGQGALAVEIRADDAETAALLEPIHCETTAACVNAERAFMNELGGGCQVPVAALAVVSGGTLSLRGMVLSADGQTVHEGSRSGPTEGASAMAAHLARALLAEGAETIMALYRNAQEGAQT